MHKGDVNMRFHPVVRGAENVHAWTSRICNIPFPQSPGCPGLGTPKVGEKISPISPTLLPACRVCVVRHSTNSTHGESSFRPSLRTVHEPIQHHSTELHENSSLRKPSGQSIVFQVRSSSSSVWQVAPISTLRFAQESAENVQLAQLIR